MLVLPDEASRNGSNRVCVGTAVAPVRGRRQRGHPRFWTRLVIARRHQPALTGDGGQNVTKLRQTRRDWTSNNLEDTSAIRDSLPDLSTPLANADPELRRRVYDAFQFGIGTRPQHPPCTTEGARIERLQHC